MPFPQRKIGTDSVSAMGLGCMGMSFGYTSFGGYSDSTSLSVLSRAADLGVTFWDTSDLYGPETNERLLGQWFHTTGRRDEIFLASKFGNCYGEGGRTNAVRGDREYVHWACAKSLERLGVETIDLYYQHRVDTGVPIEETVRALVELKQAGKIRYLGLSECSARTLRRACAVHPIAAVQLEYSPFNLEIEDGSTDLLATARELGVKVVCYSPLGRGMLTGTIKSRADLDEKDSRVQNPRFSDEHFAANAALVEALAGIAQRKGISASQLCLAWVMAQGEDFFPIPGTKKVKYLEENARAAEVVLSREEVQEVRDEITKAGGGKGKRYKDVQMALCMGDTPELPTTAAAAA